MKLFNCIVYESLPLFLVASTLQGNDFDLNSRAITI